MIDSKKSFRVLGLLALALHIPASAWAEDDADSYNSVTTYFGVGSQHRTGNEKYSITPIAGSPYPSTSNATSPYPGTPTTTPDPGTGVRTFAIIPSTIVPAASPGQGGYPSSTLGTGVGLSPNPVIPIDLTSTVITAGRNVIHVGGGVLKEYNIQGQGALTKSNTGLVFASPGGSPNLDQSAIQPLQAQGVSLRADGTEAMLSRRVFGACHGLIGGGGAGEINYQRNNDEALGGVTYQGGGLLEVNSKAGLICKTGKVFVRAQLVGAVKNGFGNLAQGTGAFAEGRAEAYLELAKRLQMRGTLAFDAGNAHWADASLRYKFNGQLPIPLYVGLEVGTATATDSAMKAVLKSENTNATDPRLTTVTTAATAGFDFPGL